MRGSDINQSAMFSYLSAEERVPVRHPLRPIQEMCNQALRQIDGRWEGLYSNLGRPSIPPEKLLRALVLQILYTVRSERLLMEQLNYNLLFRWFVGLNMDDKVWDATVYSQNRDRLLGGDIAQAFFEAVLLQAREQNLLSDEHFTVDGTLLDAWASKKSYQPKENPPEEGSGSRGEMLLRDTHECKTDPDAVLYKKSAGGESRLCHMGHVLMENRNGLPVSARITEAITSAEWEAALEMLQATTQGKGGTVGADTGYDTEWFVRESRKLNITPHVAQHTKRASSIDGRTTRHEGYTISLKKRKRVEQIFGWLKTTGGMRKLRHRGRDLVQWMFTLSLSVYNMVRMRTIALQAAKA
jgi:transposase